MSVYQDITNMSRPYLGPATEQFITRQCTLFLKTTPDGLTKKHLPELAKAVEISALRLMDKAKAEELAAKIAKF